MAQTGTGTGKKKKALWALCLGPYDMCRAYEGMEGREVKQKNK
jgi:hypothetical protein